MTLGRRDLRLHGEAARAAEEGILMQLCSLVLAGFLACAGALASAQAHAQAPQSDPPALAGRIAEISGTVSFHGEGDSDWGPASLNYPITAGNALWTEPRSHAAVDLGASRIYLDSSTELDIGRLDDQGFVASLPQGAIYLRVYPSADSGQFEIDTPRGQVLIRHPGNYEVTAGDAGRPTVATVFGGVAEVTSPGATLALGAQQSVSIQGEGNQLSVTLSQAAPPDDFIRFVQDQERPYANPPTQLPQQYGSTDMTGYLDLGQYGSWQSTPDYGPVWYPQVAAGWAPYRFGHWAYVFPWGWTWIDDAPWGFAPFHYGRWVYYGNRWGWWPGVYQPYPVYAPALVAFFGGFGFSFGSVIGWVALGPDEVYYPGYWVSPGYLRRVNVGCLRRSAINYNYRHAPPHYDYGHYRNHQHGATMVPGDTLIHSRPVAPSWRQMPQGGGDRQWRQARGYDGQAPIKPSLATSGFNQFAAQRTGIAPTGQPNKRINPGPKIQFAAPAGGSQPQGLGGGQTLHNKSTGPSLQPYSSGTRRNLQPGTTGPGGQPATGGQAPKNQGAPVLPYSGSGKQNLQPGAGGQNLKNKGAPSPTVVPYSGPGARAPQPGAGQNFTPNAGHGQNLQPYSGSSQRHLQPGGQVPGTGGSHYQRDKGFPPPPVPPSGGGQRHLQPSTGSQRGNCPPGSTHCGP